jgi:hypothetical protein
LATLLVKMTVQGSRSHPIVEIPRFKKKIENGNQIFVANSVPFLREKTFVRAPVQKSRS